MAYALLFACLGVVAAVLHMRVVEGAFLWERFFTAEALWGLAVVLSTLVLAFVVDDYPTRVSSLPRGYYLALYAALPGVGLGLIVYPEIVQSAGEFLSIRWVQTAGWVIIGAVFLLSVSVGALHSA